MDFISMQYHVFLPFLFVSQLAFSQTNPTLADTHFLKLGTGLHLGQTYSQGAIGTAINLDYSSANGDKFKSWYLSGHGEFITGSYSSTSYNVGYLTGESCGDLGGMTYAQYGGGLGVYQRCSKRKNISDGACAYNYQMLYPHVKAVAGTNFNVGVAGYGLEVYAKYEVEEVSVGLMLTINYGKMWR